MAANKRLRHWLTSGPCQVEMTYIKEKEMNIPTVDAADVKKHLFRRSFSGLTSVSNIALTFQRPTWKGGGALSRQTTHWIAKAVPTLNDPLATQSSFPVLAGSHAATCNTCRISVRWFSGGTCGGRWSFSIRWHQTPTPPSHVARYIEESLTKYWAAPGFWWSADETLVAGAENELGHTDCCWASSCWTGRWWNRSEIFQLKFKMFHCGVTLARHQHIRSVPTARGIKPITGF